MPVAGRLVVVIPAYNEERNIARLLRNLTSLDHGAHDARVIVVNDGSQDRTREVALSFAGDLDVEVVDHAANLGVGQAFRTGFGAALKHAGPDDIVVTIEADNTSDLAVLRAMLAQIRGGSDVSLASCYAPGGRVLHTTPGRLILSKAANLIVRWLLPVPDVHTYSSFYRAYRASALHRARQRYGERLIEEPGFVCMVEVLVKLHRLGLRITEVPMVLDGALRAGGSKMRIMWTIFGYSRFFVRDAVRWVDRRVPLMESMDEPRS